jgi:hypothetical protein
MYQFPAHVTESGQVSRVSPDDLRNRLISPFGPHERLSSEFGIQLCRAVDHLWTGLR